jgi:hypothetical protein
MKNRTETLIRRSLKEEHGQVLPWVAFMMLLLLGVGAFVLDIGHAFFCYHELQMSTDAAALAGAQQIKNANPKATATAFSAVAGSANTNPNLSLNGSNSVSMVPGYPKLVCLTTITNLGIACTAPNNANAIIVSQQALIPTFFAQVFGLKQMTISTTATAALSGAKQQPVNIAIVLDTTASMTTVDSNCIPTSGGGAAERIVCAEDGVTQMLQTLSPCSTVFGCGTPSGSTVQYPVDSVAIFTFPNVTTGTVAQDYDCSSGTNPTVAPYTFPSSTGTTYSPSGSTTGTYEIVPFEENYKTGTNADFITTLNTSSDLALAVGAGKVSGSGCPGMQAPGGTGTYYAGVIYAAQAALVQQYAWDQANVVEPNGVPITPQSVMIILTDGEANSSGNISGGTYNGKAKMGTATNVAWPSSGSGILTNYPSTLDQCQQAVAAAQYAQSQGTIVYTVAYGSESSGCTTDSTGPQKNITPCQVMGQMATPSYTDAQGNVHNFFYSDYNQSGSGSSCTATGTSVTSIADIFTAITADFLQARLIPNGTT